MGVSGAESGTAGTGDLSELRLRTSKCSKAVRHCNSRLTNMSGCRKTPGHPNFHTLRSESKFASTGTQLGLQFTREPLGSGSCDAAYLTFARGIIAHRGLPLGNPLLATGLLFNRLLASSCIR